MKRHTLGHLIAATGAVGVLEVSFVVAVVSIGGDPVSKAVVHMGAGLVLLWCVGGGIAMRILRDRIRPAVLLIPIRWDVRFLLFCTVLALVEEAITTSMTNLAPVFGVPVGRAYITASASYLDVVLGHSVILFVPMFACWAFILSRLSFHPNAVFLLYGLTGALAEASSFGLQSVTQAPMWIFVYGLMVYLPAYCLPDRPDARPPRPVHYPMAVLLPFVAAIPVAGGVGYLHPIKVHFPPITPGR
jgi:hypothetical protein